MEQETWPLNVQWLWCVSPWAQPLQMEKRERGNLPLLKRRATVMWKWWGSFLGISYEPTLSSSFMKTLSNSAVVWFWKNGRPYVADLSPHSVLAPPAIASSGWNARNVAWTSKTTTRTVSPHPWSNYPCEPLQQSYGNTCTTQAESGWKVAAFQITHR